MNSIYWFHKGFWTFFHCIHQILICNKILFMNSHIFYSSFVVAFGVCVESLYDMVELLILFDHWRCLISRNIYFLNSFQWHMLNMWCCSFICCCTVAQLRCNGAMKWRFLKECRLMWCWVTRLFMFAWFMKLALTLYMLSTL